MYGYNITSSRVSKWSVFGLSEDRPQQAETEEENVMFWGWNYKTIAGQPHRKCGTVVQAMWLGEWCTVPTEMWGFKGEAE